MSDTDIEAKIVALGLTAPRLTPADIQAAIVGEAYYRFPATTLTICALTLRNGFQVTGESAAASPANFDQDVGRQIARNNAVQKIWMLEGYRLKQELFEKAQADELPREAYELRMEPSGGYRAMRDGVPCGPLLRTISEAEAWIAIDRRSPS